MPQSSRRTEPGKGKRGSGGITKPAEPRFIAIGRIGRPHGLRGEVVVHVLTDFPERFESMKEVYVGHADSPECRQVTGTRWHKDRVLLSLQGCDSRTSAESLRGLLIQIPIEDARQLHDNEYYPHQLLGMDVVTVDGEDLGRISDILYTNANDVYVVVGPRGQTLLPAITDVIQRVDLAEGRMIVTLIPGLV